MKHHHAKPLELHCHEPALKSTRRVFEVSREMAVQRHRLLSATLLLVGVLAAAACSQTKGDAQAQPSAASALTPSQPSSPPAPPSAGARDAPMDPNMKDHNHPMGAGMEGHAHKHDGGHP